MEKAYFRAQLKDQLATIVPINADRFELPAEFQVDDTYYYFTMTVKSTPNLAMMNTNNILKSLDALIKNGDMTLISRFNTTKYLDQTYGVQVAGKYIRYYNY